MTENAECANLAEQYNFIEYLKVDFKINDYVIEIIVNDKEKFDSVEIVRIKDGEPTRIFMWVPVFEKLIREAKEMHEVTKLPRKSPRFLKNTHPDIYIDLTLDVKNKDNIFNFIYVCLDYSDLTFTIENRTLKDISEIIIELSDLEKFISACDFILKKYNELIKNRTQSPTNHTSTTINNIVLKNSERCSNYSQIDIPYISPCYYLYNNQQEVIASNWTIELERMASSVFEPVKGNVITPQRTEIMKKEFEDSTLRPIENDENSENIDNSPKVGKKRQTKKRRRYRK